MNSKILSMASRIILPIGLLFSFHILFRGHNEPGGGFIAGLLTATVIALQYVTFGIETVDRYISIKFYLLIVLGLTLAFSTGLASFYFGYPFLTSKVYHWHHVPLFGEIELVTATFFDLGVYLIVVGATIGIFHVLGEQKEWN